MDGSRTLRDNYWTKKLYNRRSVLVGGVVGAAGTVGLATVGCSSSSSSNATPTKQASASASAVARKAGGMVTVAGWAQADVLDPVAGQGGQDQGFLWCLYDNLVGYDKNLNPDASRSLASSWESPDATTLVFHLRPNVKFSDGSAVDANAVKASIMHGLDKSIKTNSVLGDLSPISSIDATDASTVTFHLSAADYPLLPILGDRPGMIVNMAYLEKVGQDQFNRQPGGSGAFTVQEWVQNDHVTMVKNPNFWQQGHPYVDQIVFKFISNTSVADEGFLANQVTLMWAPDAKDWDAVSKQARSNAKRAGGVGWSGILLDNVTAGPLTNEHARRAMSFAIDRDSILKTAFGGFGHVATNAIGPGNTYVFDPKVGASTQTYDPAKAAQELAAAGLSDGFKISATTVNTPAGIQIASIVKDNLSKIKVDLTVIPEASPNYYLDYYAFKSNALFAGFSGRADPIDTLNFSYGAGGNYVLIKHQPARPDIDAALTKAVGTQDQKARAALYNQVAGEAADGAYDIYLVYGDTLAASNNLAFEVFGDGKPHLGQGDIWFEK